MPLQAAHHAAVVLLWFVLRFDDTAQNDLPNGATGCAAMSLGLVKILLERGRLGEHVQKITQSTPWGRGRCPCASDAQPLDPIAQRRSTTNTKVRGRIDEDHPQLLIILGVDL